MYVHPPPPDILSIDIVYSLVCVLFTKSRLAVYRIQRLSFASGSKEHCHASIFCVHLFIKCICANAYSDLYYRLSDSFSQQKIAFYQITILTYPGISLTEKDTENNSARMI